MYLANATIIKIQATHFTFLKMYTATVLLCRRNCFITWAIDRLGPLMLLDLVSQ